MFLLRNQYTWSQYSICSQLHQQYICSQYSIYSQSIPTLCFFSVQYMFSEYTNRIFVLSTVCVLRVDQKYISSQYSIYSQSTPTVYLFSVQYMFTEYTNSIFVLTRVYVLRVQQQYIILFSEYSNSIFVLTTVYVLRVQQQYICSHYSICSQSTPTVYLLSVPYMFSRNKYKKICWVISAYPLRLLESHGSCTAHFLRFW